MDSFGAVTVSFLKFAVLCAILTVKAIFKLKRLLDNSLKAINSILTNVLSVLLLFSFVLLDVLYGLLDYEKLDYNAFDAMLAQGEDVKIGNGFQTLVYPALPDLNSIEHLPVANPRSKVHWWKPAAHSKESVPELVPDTDDVVQVPETDLPNDDSKHQRRERFKRQFKLSAHSALHEMYVGKQMKQLKGCFNQDPPNLTVIDV